MIVGKILVASNDGNVCDIIRDCMQSSCADICCLASTSEALVSFAKQDYFLVILDKQLVGINIIEILRTMRQTNRVPILLLSDPISSDYKVALIQAGADVIIEKPLNEDLCAAQAKALIQLYSKADNDQKNQISFGVELVIMPCFRQVFIDGNLLPLTRKEFDLLNYLVRYPRQVFSREQLYVRIWHDSFASSGDETVRVHIQNLRKKLASRGKNFIHNVWGVGYKFVPPECIQD